MTPKNVIWTQLYASVVQGALAAGPGLALDPTLVAKTADKLYREYLARFPPPLPAPVSLPAIVSTGARRSPGDLSCSFCGKSRKDVTHIIAGSLVYICNECVELSVEIINEDKPKPKPTMGTTPESPLVARRSKKNRKK